jgi:hypothetical protein
MRRCLGAVVATAVALTLPAAPAAAKGAPGTTAAAPSHCVLRASRAGAPPTAPTCFASFRAAIAWATDGRVTDAPESAGQAATDRRFAARLDGARAAARAVVGIDYADAGYRGGALTLTAPAGCDNDIDVDWQFPSLPARWNDRISSFRTYSNCLQQLFRDVSFRTAVTPKRVSSPWVGAAANDQASSIRFY